MITGFCAVWVVWLLLFGLNVPVRWWRERRHLKRQEVLAKFEVRLRPQRVNWIRLIMYPVWLAVLTATAGDQTFTAGVFSAAVLIAILWPFYLRGRTRTAMTLLFDRRGMTVFPARLGLLSRGVFETRLDWVDCFGYSYYQGYVLFALQAGGQMEQQVSSLRLPVSQVLSSLGIRKLKAYDVLTLAEADEQMLAQVEQQVLAMAQDVVAGYQADAAAMGLHLQVEALHTDDSEDQNEPYVYLHMSLWDEENQVDDLDWLIWAKYQESCEVLHFSPDRLYEALDERVLSLIESRMREMGLDALPSLLQ